ncbi:superkiller complex protein 8-like isoform X2 [Maniola hyperantus]|uniref:superkiller complex protein 8-like isoform X2 n=1 Tax=Aphantopus hyperantus TaxID=2795564 RepID=UPI00156A4D97|nr:WD repeat-containing protein 61-like isoform X2 [Maniola hyperantus]
MPAAAVYSLLIKKENAHEDPIYCCVWTRIANKEDPKKSQEYIVTGGLDNLVKVWSLENNRLELLHTLEGHCMAVVSIAVSPDGYTIASSSLDSTLIIWELTTGIKVHEIETANTNVWQVAFSPNGTQLVSGSHTGKLTVYGIVKNNVDCVLDTRGKFALCVAWSKNGQCIASGAVDGAVHLFNVAQIKLVHTIEAHTEIVRSVDFSPNSHLLLTASNDGFVKIFDVASGNEVSKLSLKSWGLNARFSPDGTRLAAAAGDGAVVVALLHDTTLLKTFREHTDTAWDVQFNAQSNRLLSVGKDKTLNIYECPVPAKPDIKK